MSEWTSESLVTSSPTESCQLDLTRDEHGVPRLFLSPNGLRSELHLESGMTS